MSINTPIAAPSIRKVPTPAPTRVSGNFDIEAENQIAHFPRLVFDMDLINSYIYDSATIAYNNTLDSYNSLVYASSKEIDAGSYSTSAVEYYRFSSLTNNYTYTLGGLWPTGQATTPLTLYREPPAAYQYSNSYILNQTTSNVLPTDFSRIQDNCGVVNFGLIVQTSDSIIKSNYRLTEVHSRSFWFNQTSPKVRIYVNTFDDKDLVIINFMGDTIRYNDLCTLVSYDSDTLTEGGYSILLSNTKIGALPATANDNRVTIKRSTKSTFYILIDKSNSRIVLHQLGV